MTFAAMPPWWAAVAGAGAILALAWLAYRPSRALLGPRQRTLLVALRAGVLALLVLVLMRPIRVEPQPLAGGLVPVLVDASASMTLTDGGERSRFEQAMALARTRVVPALERGYVPRLFTFGERLSPLDLDAEAVAEARASRLGDALAELRDVAQGRPLAGIVVISDGAVSAQASASRPEAPIFAVALGADRIGSDREVFGVAIGDARVQSSLVDVSALVASRGASREPFDVTLSQNGRPVAVRRVAPSADAAAQRIVFRVAPSRESATLYTVSAAAGEGEWTLANNRQGVLAAPAGPPRRVLLIEGAPGHEHSFLKRSLDEDPGLSVDAVVRKGENDRGEATFYVQAGADRAAALSTGFPASRAALLAYDAVMLANVDRSLLPARALPQLAEFVAERGGGLVVLGGRSFQQGGLQGSALEPLLPVDLVDRAGGLVRAARGARDPFHVGLTEAGREHPVMRLGASPKDTARAWEAAPALASTAALGPARAGATVLATTTSPGGVPRPLVAVQRYGRGRVLLFGGEASWRWKMMLAAGDATYDSFWRQSVRWTAADADAPVVVTARAEEGRRVMVAAEIRDAEFAGIPGADVRLRVTGPSGRELEVPASRSAGGATVSASFEAAESGVHKVSVVARRGGEALGAAEAWALVGGVDGEFVDPRRTVETLDVLARASGGRLVEAAEADAIAEWIGESAARHTELVQRELWHSPWVWALLVGVLGTEWTLRRRWGLR